MPVQSAVVSTDGTPSAGGAPAASNESQRPTWLDEKFKTPEDLATAYKEAERRITELTAPKTPATPTIPTPDATSQAVADAGLNMEALSREYTENDGKLTPETLKTLKAKGISESVVGQYAAGQQAIAAQIVNEFAQAAGGEEQLKALYSWAQAEMTPEDLKAYNKVMDSRDRSAQRLAFQGLMARYQQATGNEAILIGGEGAPNIAGVQPYKSTNEVIAAMSDPRYKAGDPEYVKEVENKMRRTNLFSIRGG